MTKEEKIKEAWNNTDGLNTEVWSNYWTYEKAKEHGMDENGWIKVCGYEPREGTVCDYMRPPQLKGIEDNNSWVKIESEEDLPKEKCDLLVYPEFENHFVFHFYNDKESEELLMQNHTHYQSIKKPNPPLF